MKTNNIFDYMSNDRDSLSEQTIMETTGVKLENVKEIFMNKVNAEKKASKKTGSKKVFVIMAAAVAATLAIGTITAGAAGSFNAVFGEHFAGERVNGIYSGGNINITTNGDYQAELLGVTGDKYNAFSAISIKRADGQNFVDDIDDYYIQSDVDINGYVSSSGEVYETGNHRVDLTPIQNLLYQIDSTPFYENKFCQYQLTAPDTIKAVYSISRDRFELVGQKMETTINTLYIMHNISDICELSIVFGENFSQEELDREAELTEKKLAEAEKTLKNNQVIHRLERYSLNEKGETVITMSYTVAEYEKLDIALTGSWNLNYQSTEIPAETSDKVFNYQGIEYQVSAIETRAVSAKITLEIKSGDVSQFEIDGYNYWTNALAGEGVIITLKNGQTLEGSLLEAPLVTGKISGNKAEMEIVYFMNHDNWVNINPEEVVSITIAGNVITK